MLSIGCGEVVHCFPSELPILILAVSILVMSGLDMSKCVFSYTYYIYYWFHVSCTWCIYACLL